ncbi:ATP-binding protein [Actinomadura xylanilytica]|uniref:ATP-binding protein n=1 Tax=Actinomadura xylanilytica TaxID=887459 RepID=UPI00255A8A59|nr:ATP-binding protein [Actinomadura xylanilytica]MDL4770726.1 ATP-binding protein [Actinomadura xylanilytica]
MTAQHLGSRVFAADPSEAKAARRWLNDLIGSAHPAQTDAALLLTEALSNAIKHTTSTKIEVRATTDGSHLHIDVIDEGAATVPHVRRHSDAPDNETALDGRGLLLIETLATDYGFQRLTPGPGLRFWFSLPAI